MKRALAVAALRSTCPYRTHLDEGKGMGSRRFKDELDRHEVSRRERRGGFLQQRERGRDTPAQMRRHLFVFHQLQATDK